MSEDSTSILYEPLAELSLKYENDVDYIYCLCSRVLVCCHTKNQASSVPNNNEVCQVYVNGEHDLTATKPCSVATQKNCHKKREESVSCYYSASQYSTDEHDSCSQPALESDSGADLSVTSRDLEWERYWAQNGDRLVWESWITKYNSYIDPTYFNSYGNQNLVSNDVKEDQSDHFDTASSDSSSEEADDKSNVKFNDEFQSQDEQKLTEEDKKSKEQINAEPPILSVGDYDREISGDTNKCVDVTKDQDDFDDQFRLRTGSRSSGNSGRFTATTDSMTNVTRMTFSTSNSSSEDLSKIDSSLSPTSSATSYTEQWQQLWNEHFNELYNTHYSSFVLRYKESDPLPFWEPVVDIINDVLVDPEFDENPDRTFIDSSDQLANQSVDDVLSAKIGQVEISKTEKVLSSEVLEKYTCKNNVKPGKSDYANNLNTADQESSSIKKETKEKSKRTKNKKQLEYLIENAVSTTIKKLIASKHLKNEDSADELKSPERISEDSVCNSDSSLITSVPLKCDENSSIDQAESETLLEFKSEIPNDVNISNSDISSCKSNLNNKLNSLHSKENSSSVVNSATSESFSLSPQQQNPVILKRNQKLQSNLNRMNHTCSLMGYEFLPLNHQNLEELHINYLKSNIKQQNNALRMYSRKHTYFDDDGNPVLEKVKRFLEKEKENAKEGIVLASPYLNSLSSPESSKYTNSKDQIRESTSEESNELVSPVGAVLSSEVDHEFLKPVETCGWAKVSKITAIEEEKLVSNESTPCSSSSEQCDAEEKSRQVTKKLKKKARPAEKNIKKQRPIEITANPKLHKYWAKRYHLFSKFDEGIKLDEESWYSVTPECMSKHISERCKCDLIIDAFCGAGGNSIQFALTCERVIAIDIDPVKIELARNNARVYGVEDRIEFIVGDFFKLAPTLAADVLFLSPPWGGPSYLKDSCFDLDKILPPVGGRKLLEIGRKITNNVCYYLPRNCNVDQLIPLSGDAYEIEVEQNFLQKRMIAISLYFGELIHVEE